MAALIKLKKAFFSAYKLPNVLNTKHFINGEFIGSLNNKTFPVINPATEEIITHVHEASTKEIDMAVNSAKDAFEKGPWSSFSSFERSECLYKLSNLMEKNRDTLALIESINSGKPYKMARQNDLSAAIAMLRYYAGFAGKIQGETIPISGPFLCYTKPEPVGVCAQILPWNFPLAGIAAKVAPALAAGCTVVIKPAELTPLSALHLASLFNEAGFPKGVINIVNGFGHLTGEALMKHPFVNKISFTGSTQVGLHIMKNCHGEKLKKVSLELGGKSPLIICEDADIEAAAKQAQGAVFYNSGQICIAGSRIFVHEKIHKDFVNMSCELAKEKYIGDPLDEKTEQGPLISSKQRERFTYYVNKGKKEGAKLLVGGKTLEGKGYFVQPTVFTEVHDEMTIAKEEIFAPVMSILKFKNIDEVIERANRSNFGLVAGVMTKNSDYALQFINKLQCGTVWHNCYGVFDASAPFGGYKNSGIEKEHGEAGLKNYLNYKTVIVKQPS